MDNATRKELLYKARAVGYPGSILDVFANYDQGKDLIGEFQQQQQMQQQMQMSDMVAQQSGLEQPQQQMQQPQQQGPQMPVVPSSPTPAPNYTPAQPTPPIGVQSQDTPVGIVSGQSGPNQGRAIFKTGGFKYEEGGPVEDAIKFSKNPELFAKAKAMGHNSIEEYKASNWGYGKNKSTFNDIKGLTENIKKQVIPESFQKIPVVSELANKVADEAIRNRQNELANYDWKNLNKQDQIDYGIEYLKYHDPTFKPGAEVPMRMTAWMESTYGNNPKAYNRRYTNSFMSLDKTALDDVYIPKGDKGRYMTKQKEVLDVLERNGYNNRQQLEKALREDDPKATLLASKLYYKETSKLEEPNPNNPKEVFNYHYNVYNKAGSAKHNTEEEEYQRFLKGWDKYGPEYKPAFKKLGGTKCYTCVGRKRRV
jgi:hypothetical protein